MFLIAYISGEILQREAFPLPPYNALLLPPSAQNKGVKILRPEVF